MTILCHCAVAAQFLSRTWHSFNMSTTGNAISANVAASTTQTQSMQAPQPAAPEPPAQGSDQASSGAVSVHVPGSAPALSGTGAPTVTDTPRSMHDILNTSQPWYQSLANVSNLITFVVFLIGLLLVSLDDHVVFKYILATGLFGFAGTTCRPRTTLCQRKYLT